MKFQSSFTILLSTWLVCKTVALNCITWDVIKDDLHLIYKTDDFFKPVILKDNNGNTTVCSFEKSSYHCRHIPLFGVINPNINRKEIIFTIEDVKSKDVDGTWYILQGGKTFNTTVSLTNGFIGSTDIYITGEVNISKVTVRCFSCRVPYGQNAEFLINDRSEDSLTMNSATGKCTHQAGECNPETCSCSLSGNEFSRSFHLQNTSQTLNLSCDMMFADSITTPFFSKYATLFYDGTDVHSKETKTNKKNSSENSNKTKDYAEKDFTGLLIGIVVFVVIVSSIVVVAIYVYRIKQHEEAKSLNSDVSPSCEDLRSSKDELSPQTNNHVNDSLLENELTCADKIVQTSEDEISPQMINQVNEGVIGNESTHVDKIVQTSEDNQNIDRFQCKQMSNSATTPFDVVFIFDVAVERKWVERAVEMLEEQCDLVCGLISRDLMIGLQTADSFNCIEKHTPVVVTFSEKSCKRQHAIRIIENIDKLVAVMVEECSPPIFSINMKCVDATLDEEQWLKQLFTALNIKMK